MDGFSAKVACWQKTPEPKTFFHFYTMQLARSNTKWRISPEFGQFRRAGDE
jgi:hypothetical protein